MKSTYLFLILITLATGCGSINAHSEKEYTAGSVYPGTRAYSRDMVSLVRNDPNDPNYRTEFGRNADIGVLIFCAPIWVPDMLIFTPVADTLFLPHDLFQNLTVKEKEENIQQDCSTLPRKLGK